MIKSDTLAAVAGVSMTMISAAVLVAMIHISYQKDIGSMKPVKASHALVGCDALLTQRDCVAS